MARFQKGISGNPRGTPTGSKHKATLLAEKLLAEDTQEVVRTVIAKAKDGDMAAAKLVLERILPPCKAGRMVKLALPSVSSAADLLPALDSITDAVGQGLITPEEGQHIAAIFAQTQRVLELVELEQRLSRLEARHE